MATPKLEAVTIDLPLETFHADPAAMSLFRHAAFEKNPPTFPDNGPSFGSMPSPPWLSPSFVIHPTMDPLTPPCDSATAACDAIKNLPDRLESIAKEMRLHLDMVMKFAASHPARADFARMIASRSGGSVAGSGTVIGNDAASSTSHGTCAATTTTVAASGPVVVPAGGAGGAATAAPNSISRIQFQALMSRVEDLEHEISRLRGRTDAHQNRINGIEGGLRALSRFGNRGQGGQVKG